MNPISFPPTHRRRQSGAILVVSLLLLLVLTVLGIAMMKMTNMQDRMAGNTRDVNVAFQGAEAALRVGEGEVRTLVAPGGVPVTQATTDCDVCAAGVLPLDIDDPASFDWNTEGFAAPDVKTADNNLYRDPRYKIEHSAFVADGPDTGVNGAGSDTGRDVFTITGRSTGLTDQANTVVQSTYARRF